MKGEIGLGVSHLNCNSLFYKNARLLKAIFGYFLQASSAGFTESSQRKPREPQALVKFTEGLVRTSRDFATFYLIQ